jgi:hypothetical protein
MVKSQREATVAIFEEVGGALIDQTLKHRPGYALQGGIGKVHSNRQSRGELYPAARLSITYATVQPSSKASKTLRPFLQGALGALEKLACHRAVWQRRSHQRFSHCWHVLFPFISMAKSRTPSPIPAGSVRLFAEALHYI